MHWDQSADEVLEGDREVIVDLAADEVTTAEVVTGLAEVVLIITEALEEVVAQLFPIKPRTHHPDDATLVETGILTMLVATGRLMLLVVTTELVPQLVPKPKIQKRLSNWSGAAEATPAKVRRAAACMLR